MDGVIVLLVAMGAVGALALGSILLVLYFRSGRDDLYGREPVIYGHLIQCPHCGYMNPLDSGACLQCRYPLPGAPSGYGPPRPSAPPADYGSPPVRAHAKTLPEMEAAPPRSPRVVSRPGAPTVPPPPSSAQATVGNRAPQVAFPPRSASARPPDMPRAWLEGVGGAASGHHFVITQADTLVGRSTVCDVQIFDPKVSRKHFLIRFGNGAFFIQDQQSSRGTHINGERTLAQRLRDGDRIDLGDAGLVFHVE